jgi:putative ABC transport system permease protein
MSIPYAYTLKNLCTRGLTTTLTAAGMALVVYVFATVLMLSEGLKETLVGTGSPDNVLVIRHAASTEIQSAIDRSQASMIESIPEIASSTEGKKLVSKELVVLIALPKRGTAKRSNATVRGLSDAGVRLRPQIRFTAGRMFRPGSSEIIVGNKIAQAFSKTGIGDRLRFGMREWTIVGIFNAGNTAFGSEVWGDVDQLMQAFRRNVYSSALFRLSDASAFERVRSHIENDPRLPLDAKREDLFYAKQSEVMANFLRVLGTTLSVTFSIGAIIGAMITMHSSVASRVTEIGTLRALGFTRRSVLGAFLGESLAIGLMGGVVGISLASGMQLLTVSTMNWQTFAELAFTFTLTPAIIAKSLAFALLMGFTGGFLPAVRAARMNVVEALKTA